MFHRHPFLSLLTFAYLGFVAWLTLTPNPTQTSGWPDLTERVIARLQTYDELSWLTFDRAEFLANVALFVPVGLFFLLMFGTRFWWLAAGAGFAMTSAIETAQRSIPGRVSDERDILANTAGALVGVLIGIVLTLPATVRRHRRKQQRRMAREDYAERA